MVEWLDVAENEVKIGGVIWHDERKKYGFVTAEDLNEDVFVRLRILGDRGFHSLMHGQELLIRIDGLGCSPKV